jgi:DNA-directed RNA polymerase subunit F
VKHPELPERVTRALGRARSARTDPEAAEELEREIVVHASLRRRDREQLDVDPQAEQKLRHLLAR